MNTFVQPVILSGGSGTRLWPLSRGSYPKQFLPLHGSDSLLAATVRRFRHVPGPGAGLRILPPCVICNEAHRFLVAEQLLLAEFDQGSIVLEPFGRNTAPALTLAALLALHDDQDPVLAVLPSDHLIQDEARFRELIVHGTELARNGCVITFGIVPTHAETGFGYIRKGPALDEVTAELARFIEKPDREKAEELIRSGNHLWNSGIFMMSASVWIEETKKHCPAVLSGCEESLAKGRRDGFFLRIDPSAFEHCPNISIDHAVMEKIAESKNGPRAVVIPMDVGWSDLGSWSAIREIKARDEHGNFTQGDVFAKDTRNSLLYAQTRLLATLGVDELIVVETKDAVLVAHKNSAQDIKSVTDYLKHEERPEHEFHQRVHRPWGHYESIDKGPRYQVKRLTVKPGASLSLQMHHHRAEHWIVVSGTARVTRGEESFLLSENESTYIPLGVMHRLENPGTLTLEIIEVQSGSYLGEDDIVRFEDRYNRVELPAKN
ncbi:MAG: mannose-1-phosphate guanylyltransferase/mannose-6-phosphate isomerase [Methylococcaceae bacterium]|nr:mannose-1-phosphate guanylyltransferase/mannose-6-phosphate isomerase [Methylococcaceae bacterium]MCI0734269.1 mannose-1-phosphate guanylyltransferase/mannose-6-phosphate isomerase [Methylococcaceae bacterium]